MTEHKEIDHEKTDTDIIVNAYAYMIRRDEAVSMMAQESGYIILDVRCSDEYASGHIPNAINVPNQAIGTYDIAD